MRLPNGYGSVYKLPGPRRRPWVARVTAGWKKIKPSKKYAEAKYEILGYFEKRTYAIEALAEYHRHPTTKTNITLAALHEEWETVKFKSGISKQMQDNYRAAWQYLRKIEDMKFKDIRTGNMQEIFDSPAKMKLGKEKKPILKDGRPVWEGKELGHSSLEKLRDLCSQLYQYAMKNDIINKNYAEFLILPKAEKTKKTAFNELELKLIEAAVGKVPYADCILMMCYTGFRITEFLNLTPFSYDAAANTLTGGIKTEAGKDRPIPIHGKIKPLLDAWLAKGGERIICRDNGKPFTAKYFREKCFAPALEQIEGVRKLSPHECRHTFASLLHSAGVDPVNIQKLMGHADFSVDAETYIHVNMDELKRAVEAI